ncbi:hypothetical protein J3D54_005804 [Pseudomonas sp. GGS8]|uniref:DUF6369 family protein n=1 Tax=Pseudomonas sp. GGS8 TaxID=2817892 RepID=UPI00209F722D|nr:DUF6369 family protein [Pseudomonas sp. GGS8]MCP1446672.1 hypothetical protein [Pseudomonas sp. GGS8]
MFYLLSLMALSAGLLAVKAPKYSIIFFGVMLSVIPTGNSYSEIISLKGIYFFDFYIAGGLGALLIRQVMTQKTQLTTPAGLLFGCGLYVVLLACGLIGSPSKYLLKDTRPFIMILSFVVLTNIVTLAAKTLTLQTVLKILIAMTAFNILDIAWLRLGLYSFQDVYYEENAYRYLDGGTYAAVAYIIYYFIDPRLFEDKKNLARICLMTSFLCLFIANSRFIFVSVFAAIIIHQYTKPARMIGVMLLGSVVLLAFIEVSNMIGADRINDALSSEGLAVQLTTRFSPALDLIRNMNPVHYFVGLGAGTPFEIPWFEYRGLDDKNSNIDSAYLTYFVKYGVIGLYLLFVFTTSITHHLKTRVAVSIATFLAVMFIVSATPYQPYAIGIAYSAIMLRALSENTARQRKKILTLHQPLITPPLQVEAR